MSWDEWGTRRKIPQSKEENQQQITYELLGKLISIHFLEELVKVIPWFCTAHLLLRITRWPP